MVNKRITTTLFLWFLNNNDILYRADGSKRIADNTLVALPLMIAVEIGLEHKSPPFGLKIWKSSFHFISLPLHLSEGDTGYFIFAKE